MSFQDEYENSINLYKDRLGEVRSLVNRQTTTTPRYDPDRIAQNLSLDSPLGRAVNLLMELPARERQEYLQESDNPHIINMVMRNTAIYNKYQDAINKRAREIDELKEKLDRMKLSLTQPRGVIQPGGEMSLASNVRLPGYIRESHSFQAMEQERQLDEFNQLILNVMGGINIPANIGNPNDEVE